MDYSPEEDIEMSEYDQIAEGMKNLRAENERLKAQLNVYLDAGVPETVYERNKELLREVDKLRGALEKLARLGNEPHYGNSDGNMIARAALEKT